MFYIRKPSLCKTAIILPCSLPVSFYRNLLLMNRNTSYQSHPHWKAPAAPNLTHFWKLKLKLNWILYLSHFSPFPKGDHLSLWYIPILIPIPALARWVPNSHSFVPCGSGSRGSINRPRMLTAFGTKVFGELKKRKE